ncbi:MAG: DMT family transporter [Hyphomicrobiaceae bacterium]
MNQPSSVEDPQHQDDVQQAAGLLVGGLFLLGLQDGLIKITSSEISLWQMQVVRGCMNGLLLFAVVRLVHGSGIPPPKRWGAVLLRALFLLGAMTLFFGGLPFLPLSDIAAGLYVFPLFVAILSAVVLKERVGPRRVIAILLGFVGSLLILKPGSASFQWVALMPVGAGLCYAAMILTTRKLCRYEHPYTLSMTVTLVFVTAGCLGLILAPWLSPDFLVVQWPFLFTGWRTLEAWVFGLLAFCSVLNLTANVGLARAYQTADSSWLAPFDYSYLVFATFWGFMIFGHRPDLASIAGMVLIAASGSFVAWRERQLARSDADRREARQGGE